jgi:hypothetical protein
MTIPVFYNDQMVGAVAQNGDVKLGPRIAALGRNHPDRRWAAGLAAFARRVQTGAEAGPYTDAAACAFARTRLLPTQEFVPVAAFSDRTLVAVFRVPAEQIRARRAELGLTWN